MIDIAQLLKDNGIQLANDIRLNMAKAGMNVTNDTAQSLRVEVKQDGGKYRLTLIGRPYFMTVQTGRKPTPGKKPSREMIQNITRWVEGRNMDINAVWAIATKIQEKGTKLWRDGGRTDIVDPAIDQFQNNVADAFLEQSYNNLILNIRAMKW